VRATAIHEAGHAVMAHLQRVPFRYVSIVPDKETLGHVRLGEWPQWAHPESSQYRERAAFDWFERRIRVDLAGQIAESYHLGRRLRFGMQHDNSNAGDAALHLCRGVEETADALLKWLYLDTRDLLTAPPAWAAVEALATALMERRTMKATTARSMIRLALRVP